MIPASSALVVLDDKDAGVSVKEETPNGGQSPAELILSGSKQLQDDLQSLGLKIKHHEDNLKSLKAQKAKLDDTILDKQGILGKYHSSAAPKIEGDVDTVGKISRHEKTAASLLCQLETHHADQASHHTLTKDILGVVATLGKVADHNLNSVLAEYLGVEKMLAVVCKTFEGVKALETYDKEGCIDKSGGVHGLGASTTRPVNGRFLIICLEQLRPYVGQFIYDDPQRRLDLFKPKSPDGESPPGFVGFAVNMLNLDPIHLHFLTSYGYGLRETLFYYLFRHTQVYRTRAEMVSALPFISDGALSLDGGMIRHPGVYLLGNREDLGLRFSVPSDPSGLPARYYEVEKEVNELKGKREKLLDDMQKERRMLDHTRLDFERKKQQFVKFLAVTSSYAAQQFVQTERGPFSPR